MKKVVDISKWNVIKNYNELSCVDGAIVKVINSANSVDGRFAEHCAGLRSANVPIIGGYNYLYANTEQKALAVAPCFMELCKTQDIPMAWLDIEDNCMKGLGSKLVKIIDIYRMYAIEHNIDIGIYTGSYFYNQYMKPYENELNDLPFWVARYPSNKDTTVDAPVPTVKSLIPNIDIDGWQYTSKCRISKACDGYLDLSVWYEDKPFRSTDKIDYTHNPYTEPTQLVKLGCKIPNDINWVKYNLWRQGMYLDISGKPLDVMYVCNGIYTKDDVYLVKLSQMLLGLEQDGIVGKITRSVWNKLL